MVVADYFRMLTMEMTGQNYNKSEHRRRLLPQLQNRTAASIELKHQNISAVLIELGCPYISGYRPMSNYQQLLFEVVAERMAGDALFDRAALAVVEQPAVSPDIRHYRGVMVEAPKTDWRIAESGTARTRTRVPFKRDYLQRECRNRSLGTAGESFVVEYECRRLHAAGRRLLSERVDHVAATKGDGLGYDVLSFELEGEERFIEVKTTAFGFETPFYVTRSELDFSREMDQQFRLYRLFDFRRQPRMFELKGFVKGHCHLNPVTFLARFR